MIEKVFFWVLKILSLSALILIGLGIGYFFGLTDGKVAKAMLFPIFTVFISIVSILIGLQKPERGRTFNPWPFMLAIMGLLIGVWIGIDERSNTVNNKLNSELIFKEINMADSIYRKIFFEKLDTSQKIELNEIKLNMFRILVFKRLGYKFELLQNGNEKEIKESGTKKPKSTYTEKYKLEPTIKFQSKNGDESKTIPEIEND